MTISPRYAWKKLVPAWNALLDRGLSVGLGTRNGQMCIEAAVCCLLDEPHGDQPSCVASAVRLFKIRLNDSPHWNSPQSRADGLRKLGLAQIGSQGVIENEEFVRRLSTKIIQRLIPMLFREVFPKNEACLQAADCCEREGTATAAQEARKAAFTDATAAYAAAAAAAAAYAAYAAADAAYAAADAAYAAADAAKSDPERYLRLAADLALDVLIELKSPGVEALKYLEGHP